MKPAARLIVIESIIPESATFSLGKWTDLQMLVCLGGRERTETEYRALLSGAGFDVQEVVATPSPLRLLVGKPGSTRVLRCLKRAVSHYVSRPQNCCKSRPECTFLAVNPLQLDIDRSLILKESHSVELLVPRTRHGIVPARYPARTFITSIAMSLLVFLAVPAHGEKGQSSYKQGRDLEFRQNYEAAYDAYQRAYNAYPQNTQYRAALTRIRFLAAPAKVHRATLLQQAGELEEALILFEEAVDIDPSSHIALQQVINTRNIIQQVAGNRTGNASQSEPELSPDILNAQAPVKLRAISNLPITLKMSEDTKLVYQTIGKLGGLNVLFDPDFISRQLAIELTGVTLREALDLVAAESKTFWKPMTGNTIFVAADNAAKRKELEENVIKTFYLSNLTAPTELQDVVNTLRSVVDVNRVQQLVSQEAIVIRGTLDQVLLAEKIVNDF